MSRYETEAAIDQELWTDLTYPMGQQSLSLPREPFDQAIQM